MDIPSEINPRHIDKASSPLYNYNVKLNIQVL
jgi:hypothetical protein